jgi:hypothetical protein
MKLQRLGREARWTHGTIVRASSLAILVAGGVIACQDAARVGGQGPNAIAAPASDNSSPGAVARASLPAKAGVGNDARTLSENAGTTPSATPLAGRLRFASGASQARSTPDLLADMESRVGPVTAARLRSARDGGRAFAQRVGVEGLQAQGIADAFTELALDIARGEQRTRAGSDERTAVVQQAAQDALDTLRTLIPETALPDAEREISQWTGDVQVTFLLPPARNQAEREALP